MLDVATFAGIFARTSLLLAATGLSGSRRRAALLHEITHIRRLDTVATLMSRVVCALHWYNPLIWFAAVRLHSLQERVCDDAVLRAEATPSEYAQFLVDDSLRSTVPVERHSEMASMWLRCLAVLATAFAASAAAAAPRNVLLIIADDQGLRPRRLRQHRGAHAQHRRARCARHAVHAGVRDGVVVQSQPSVHLTGLYSHSNGMYGLAHDVHNQHLLPWVRTLPHVLKARGYRTALVGKKHLLPDNALPFDAELAPERPGNRDVAFMAAQARAFMRRDREATVLSRRRLQRSASRSGELRQHASVAIGRTTSTYDPRKVIVPAHLPDPPEVRAGSGAVLRVDQPAR